MTLPRRVLCSEVRVRLAFEKTQRRLQIAQLLLDRSELLLSSLVFGINGHEISRIDHTNILEGCITIFPQLFQRGQLILQLGNLLLERRARRVTILLGVTDCQREKKQS